MRIGIIGYGNLGRGVECAIKQNPDMELVAVFTRRSPESVSILTKEAVVCSVEDIEQQIYQFRHQGLQRCLMSLTALIHMQEFQNILTMLMPLLRRADISELYQ